MLESTYAIGSLVICVLGGGGGVQDVIKRPSAHVGVGSVSKRSLAGCPAAAGPYLGTRQMSRHYIAEISLNMMLNYN